MSLAFSSRCARLRSLLTGPRLGILMEAHNGLSARLVEEAGFQSIWASSFTISSAAGVRDCSELSSSQFLAVMEEMSDAVETPILADGDSGHGDFNNARRFVRKLVQCGIAGVCIEDKLYPKKNSFVDDSKQLSDVEEFSGKLSASRDASGDDQFCIVARTEALIASYGVDEALRRAEAYHAAGADAIVVHSKSSTPDEIFAFMRSWDRRAPIVVIPTTYYTVTARQLEEAGVSAAVFPNHTLRAAVTAMRAVLRRLYAERTLAAVEGEITELRSLFALLDYDELNRAEDAYRRPAQPKVVPLAAPARAARAAPAGPRSARSSSGNAND